MTQEIETTTSVELEARRPNLMERGMATVEYALGIVLVVTVVTALIWSAQQGWFKELVEALFRTIFQLVTSHLVG